MSKYISPARDAIAALIRSRGPLGYTDIAKMLGKKKKTVISIIRKTREAGKKIFYIESYERHYSTGGQYGPIWATGDGKDAPRPLPDRSADIKRYNDKMRVLVNMRARVRRLEGKPVNHWVEFLRTTT